MTCGELGESGGTKVSAAYQLALEVIKERFDPNSWNIYPFHFSDGDNWGDGDNGLCLSLIGQLMALSNVFGYGEIQDSVFSHASTLMSAYSKIEDERFIRVTIQRKEDVYPALKTFFRVKGDRV